MAQRLIRYIAPLLVFLSVPVLAVTDEQRNFCLQYSYDAQQVATNKLNKVPRDQILRYIANLPEDQVPEGYKESVMLTIMEVYEMDFRTAEEAQQKSLVKCIGWYEEFGEHAINPKDWI